MITKSPVSAVLKCVLELKEKIIKKMERLKIRKYSNRDYREVCDIFYNGFFEMFYESYKMIWSRCYPPAWAFHFAVLVLSIFTSIFYKLLSGLLMFTSLEVFICCALFDAFNLRPRYVDCLIKIVSQILQNQLSILN
jgi:hypothetical protein